MKQANLDDQLAIPFLIETTLGAPVAISAAGPVIQFDLELDERSRLIHERAVRRSKLYLRAEAELLDSIIEIDQHRIYEKFGHAYVTPYCVQYLGLTEDVAANFVRVARKSTLVPEIRTAVAAGVSVSKLKAVIAIVTPENHEVWLEKAAQLPRAQLEKEIAFASPRVPATSGPASPGPTASM